MASKRIEEIMQNASAKDQAALRDSAQTLKNNNVELKTDNYGPQTPPRRAEQARTAEPKLNEAVFPNQQNGAQRIQEARERSQQPKAAESVQEPAKTQEPER
ncbi:hypothetical protein [Salmonirosea aquatica]|uniref:Uncharacterized protein n=1 Tax=Salmonirosea aquatica TaxID=2654236 RepID=A0A7C9FBX4_9BACT|nr:hypothetical protein [Cytophagaceae bacterium SJW1-29]MPR37184.1 hypothetical protein [Cytophagaceae bacterium SJW1-29]